MGEVEGNGNIAIDSRGSTKNKKTNENRRNETTAIWKCEKAKDGKVVVTPKTKQGRLGGHREVENKSSKSKRKGADGGGFEGRGRTDGKGDREKYGVKTLAKGCKHHQAGTIQQK